MKKYTKMVLLTLRIIFCRTRYFYVVCKCTNYTSSFYNFNTKGLLDLKDMEGYARKICKTNDVIIENVIEITKTEYKLAINQLI